MSVKEAKRLLQHWDNVSEKIALEHLGIETLIPRNSDALDFHEVAVWNLRTALLAAYTEGVKAAQMER